MNEQGRTVTLLPVKLDILNESESSVTLPFSAANTSEGRLVKLRNSLILQHLNGEERVSIVNLCEEYSDIFHLPNDKLTCSPLLNMRSLLLP